MTDPILIMPPAAGVVTLPEAKAHLRVTSSAEDGLIQGLIDAATQYLDGLNGILGRALAEQEWQESWDAFQTAFPLRIGPVLSIVSVSYTDDAGMAQTASGARVVTSDGVPYVYPALDAEWPSGSDVVINYLAGYSSVPAPLKCAILLHIGSLYQNRESFTDGALLPFAHEALITPYRRSLV